MSKEAPIKVCFCKLGHIIPAYVSLVMVMAATRPKYRNLSNKVLLESGTLV